MRDDIALSFSAGTLEIRGLNEDEGHLLSEGCRWDPRILAFRSPALDYVDVVAAEKKRRADDAAEKDAAARALAATVEAQTAGVSAADAMRQLAALVLEVMRTVRTWANGGAPSDHPPSQSRFHGS